MMMGKAAAIPAIRVENREISSQSPMLNAAGLALYACGDVASLRRQIPEVDRIVRTDHIKLIRFPIRWR